MQKDRMFCVPCSDTLIIKRKMYLAIMFCQAVSGPHALSFNLLLICSIQVQSVSLGVELAS